MSKGRKSSRSGEFLRTPEALRAFGELMWKTAAALNLLLITAFVLFNKHSLAAAMVRITCVSALNRALHELNLGVRCSYGGVVAADPGEAGGGADHGKGHHLPIA